MKLKLLAVLIIAGTFLSLNVFSEEQPSLTKTFDMSQPGNLEAKSSGGGVLVKTHDQAQVVIQAFVRKNGKLLSANDKRLKEVLDDFDLDFSKNGTIVTAIVKRKSRMNFGNNAGISLTILLPQEMSCDVSSSGGGVKIYGVEGTHEFSSSGGGVYLENVTGTTEAKSSGGSVSATHIKGNAQLTSSGGGVKVDGIYGNIYAHSSGGSVSLKDIHGDADASSSGGGVSVNGETGALKAKSSGGSVKVNISKLEKELYLQSSGGGVDAVIHNGDKLGMDLDLRSDRVNIELHNFSGTSEKDRVKGKMNNGGIPVYMHASGGNVNVRYND